MYILTHLTTVEHCQPGLKQGLKYFSWEEDERAFYPIFFFCSSEIPLADGAVDVVLCDVPFGRKFSCSSDMPTALPLLLREMERCIP